MTGWIAVDLDGTLAHYDGFKGEECIGEPIPEMVERVKLWLGEGKDVRVFTARVDGGEVALAMGNRDGERFREVQRVRGFIETWCLKYLGRVLPVTNKKDYGMIELWDDRCVQVVSNTGRLALRDAEAATWREASALAESESAKDAIRRAMKAPGCDAITALEVVLREYNSLRDALAAKAASGARISL